MDVSGDIAGVAGAIGHREFHLEEYATGMACGGLPGNERILRMMQDEAPTTGLAVIDFLGGHGLVSRVSGG
jgi:hypothetical protein